eukprot:TRINITY_DN11058_c0_g1_i3.p1 TRINITY_DN11058_c0_g1~~TRINITY_DN11058_c0_g1_i3.p1  ORF type:complete len:476 (+),score=78.49 TRINITY_DN11058_c0_g1_i3:25-1452(+)
MEFRTKLSEEQLQDAREQAHAMHELRGFKRSEITRQICKKSPQGQALLYYFMQCQDFADLSIVSALRALIQRLTLIGEADEISRIVSGFANRYHEQHSMNCTPDAIATLASSLLILNTDLHRTLRGGRSKMTLKDFQRNLDGAMDGGDFPPELLKAAYTEVQAEELVHAADDFDSQHHDQDQRTITAAKGRSDTVLRLFYLGEAVGDKTLACVINRKELVGPGGVAIRRRRWKQLHMALHGHMLIFHLLKHEPVSSEDATINIWDSANVRHGYARLALDYPKKDNVVSLTLLTGRTMLLHYNSTDAATTWIKTINHIAATTSAPPLAAPITSARSGFKAPQLTESKTTETIEQMTARYRAQLTKIVKDLATHRNEEQEYRSGDKLMTKYYEDKLAYLEYEEKRVKTYVQILELQQGGGTKNGLSNGNTSSHHLNTSTSSRYRFRNRSGTENESNRLSFVSGYGMSASDTDEISWV